MCEIVEVYVSITCILCRGQQHLRHTLVTVLTRTVQRGEHLDGLCLDHRPPRGWGIKWGVRVRVVQIVWVGLHSAARGQRCSQDNHGYVYMYLCIDAYILAYRVACVHVSVCCVFVHLCVSIWIYPCLHLNMT